MSVTTRIPEGRLAGYFEEFTKRFLRDEAPERASIELLSPEGRAESEGERLLGITYDPHRNSLELALESGDHRVYDPREVWVVEDLDGFVSAIEIVRQDGAKEVVTIRRTPIERRLRS
jgi:hypothetical protein